MICQVLESTSMVTVSATMANSSRTKKTAMVGTTGQMAAGMKGGGTKANNMD